MSRTHRSTQQTIEASGKRTAILVTGMHRSGTSAMTRMLNLLGCDVAPDLVEADQFNERGYWESHDIANLNEAALHSAGTDWSGWEPLDQEWYASDKREEFHTKALSLLTAKFGMSGIFVLKDPRICRMLPFWIDVIKDFGARPLIVSPIRHPFEVAMSLLKRNGMNPALAQLLWLRYVLDAEFYSRDTTRIFTYYEDLIQDWRSVAKRIANSFENLIWSQSSVRSAEEIDSFLSPELRHNRGEDVDAAVVADFSPWVRDVWAILSRWAAGQYEAQDVHALNHIRSCFDESAQTFEQPILEHRRHSNHVVTQMQALEATVADAKRALAQQEEQIRASVQAERYVIEQALTLSRRDLEQARADALRDREQALADVNRDREHSLAEAVRQERLLTIQSNQITILHKYIEDISRQAEKNIADLTVARAEAADLNGTLAELTAQLVEQEKDFAAASRDITAARSDLAAMIAERDDVEVALLKERAALATERKALATEQATVVTLRRRLLDAETDNATANEEIIVLEQTLDDRRTELTKMEENTLIQSRLFHEARRSLRFRNDDVESVRRQIQGLECDLEKAMLACSARENRLQAIENSKGWRLLTRYHRLKSQIASIISKPVNETTATYL